MKFIYFAIVLIFFSSCVDTSKKTDIDKDTICLNLQFGKSVNAPFKTSQMVDSSTYIQLDSACKVGRISEIKLHDSVLYLCDKHAEAVYRFNLSGEFLGEIQHLGRAKNEYCQISDFDVSMTNGDIFIWDASIKRFQVYSKEGEFKKSVEYRNEVVHDFAVMNNGDICIYTPYHPKNALSGAWLIDSLGTFKKQLVSISKDFNYGGIYDNYLTRIGNDTIGLMGGEDKDNFYHLTSENAIVKFHADFNIKIPKELQKRNEINTEKYAGKIYTKNRYFENDKWMFFVATDFKSSIITFYDKTNNKSYQLTNKEELIMDAEFLGQILLMDNKRIISVIYTDGINDEDKKTLRAKVPDCEVNSNPIIVFINTK